MLCTGAGDFVENWQQVEGVDVFIYFILEL